MIKKNKSGKVVKFIDNRPISNLLPRRQLLPKVYYRNDFIYIGKVNNFSLKNPNLYGGNPVILITDKNRIDIDLNNSLDWIVAEKLFQHK
jgi:CMP-N-acetylneuraminic acid synthetase